MKNTITYLLTIVTAFMFGGLVVYLAMSKQQMDAVLGPQQTDQIVSTRQEVDNQDANTTSDAFDLPQELSPKEQNTQVSINDYSEQQAKQLINNMPDYVLEQYVDKFMAADASEVITDKRRFAERAIEELYTPNDTQQLAGTAKVSFGYAMPETSANTSRVTKFAKMYAHLDTNGQVPANKYVFVKWINNQTGQVLLFEKKNISANSNQNWVSFIPSDGWQEGSYDVRFYQFDSELQPIAQTTYNVYEVIDEKSALN